MNKTEDVPLKWFILPTGSGYTVGFDYKGMRSYIATCAVKSNANMVLLALSTVGPAYIEMRDAMKQMGAKA